MGAKPEGALFAAGTPVRLTTGGHSSPREGVCVVELASLIAQEEFSDRPDCVCPVVAAFLRGWNDRAPYAERQRLAPYAERIVGSRGDREVTRERRDICLQWTGADVSRGGLRPLLTRAGTWARIAILCGPGAALRRNEGAGDYAARVAMARGEEEHAFELLDALLAAGEHGRPKRPAVDARANGHPNPSDNGHASSNGNRRTASNGNGRAALNGNGLPVSNGAGPAVNGGSRRRARVPTAD
jgi:hypothetical protein